MVVVSPVTKKQMPSKRKTQCLAIIAVLLTAVGTALIFMSSLSWRIESTNKRTSLLKNIRKADVTNNIKTAEIHLSAKHALVTGRPYLLYGTAWKKENTSFLVSQALHSGFRFIDTACQPKHYDEAGVGKGWTDAASKLGLERFDIFLQTKFTSVNGQDPNNIPYDKTAPLETQVKQSFAVSLQNLRTDYIDSLVLHSPMKTMDDTLRVWKVFESFVADGKVRQLGISNMYNFRDFRLLYQEATIKPSVLQNRFHDQTYYDVKLREICKAYGVKYQSFWTLTAPANRKAMADPVWKDMAKDKGLTPQTLMYAYMMSMGHLPLDGSKNVDHMKEDVELMMRFQNGDEVLDEDEINTLSRLLGIE